MASLNTSLFNVGSLVVSCLFIILLTFQYPLVTTFPIGGDATRYIARTEAVADKLPNRPLEALQTLATNSRYPGAILTLLPFKLLPLSWPERFIWWTVVANLAVVTSLAYIAYKRSGPLAASLAAFIWTLALTGSTRHIEDATIAQLISLAPIPLLLHGFAGPHPWRHMAILIPLATLLHPVSGFVAALISLAAIPHLTTKKLFTPGRIITACLAAIIAIPLLWSQRSIFSQDLSGSDTASLPDLIQSPLGPFLLLLPLALTIIWQTTKSRPWPHILTIFTITSLLLTFNHYLAGDATYPFRFQSYLVLSISLTISLALPRLLTAAFPVKTLRIGFILTLCLSLAALSWHRNSQVFAFYESPSRYARLHPGEQAAIDWAGANLPSNSFIASTTVNRHSEWIPLLTSLPWQKITTDTLPPDATHLMIFTHREKPQEVLDALHITPEIIYETKDASIYAL